MDSQSDLCMCDYNDVRACDRANALVERWQRQIEISKGYRFLSTKVTQAITWHIDLYPRRQRLPQNIAQHTDTHVHKLKYTHMRPGIYPLPTPNYYCFLWKSRGWLRSLRSWPLGWGFFSSLHYSSFATSWQSSPFISWNSHPRPTTLLCLFLHVSSKESEKDGQFASSSLSDI